jgi:hypothetical protein
MKPELLDKAPPGSQAAAHPSGWMQTEIYAQWFDHFLKHANPSQASPVLLILDGHKTHTTNLEVINKAREHHVTLLCLPPHCSHRLQPLDVSFMKPLSTFYTQEVEKWLHNHTGRVVTIQQLPSLFRKAYLRAASALTAVNGFRKTGIFPVNIDVFTEVDFAASAPTDRPLPPTDANPSDESAVDIPDNSVNPSSSPVDTPASELGNSQSNANNLSVSVTSITTVGQSDVAVGDDVPCCRYQSNDTPVHTASQHKVKRRVHVIDISPVPKAAPRSSVKSSRARGKTVVLTSSPYKTELANRQQSAKGKAAAPQKRKLNLVKSNEEKDSSQKEYAPTKKSRKGKDKQRNVQKRTSGHNTGNSAVTFCGGCDIQEFSNEDKQMACGWIMCGECMTWFHDPCSETNGVMDDDGSFTCRSCCA